MFEDEKPPEPVSDKKFEDYLDEIGEYCFTALGELDEFETYRDKSEIQQAYDSALTSLSAFTDVMHGIEDETHPVDVERFIKNSIFYQHLFDIVKGIKESKVVEFVEAHITYTPGEEVPLWEEPPKLLQSVKEMLIRADVYLKSYQA